MEHSMTSKRTGIATCLTRPRLGRRIAALLAALSTMGFCVAIFRIIQFGTDPCSTMSLGISRVTGISFGTCQLALNAALMLLVLRFDIRQIGIGTLANMVLVGYVADAFMWVFSHVPALGALNMAGRIALFVPAMALFLVAVSIYMVVDLGSAPYDALPVILAARMKKGAFKRVRMTWDIAALTIGYVLGSTVGLTTLVTGFCLGPAIAAVGERVRPFFE